MSLYYIEGVGGSGGSGGGGSAKFPTVVTDSGSSLPVDLTGYNEGDTFLNTSDKKIYTAGANGYTINSNFDYNISNNLLDTTTGILDFSGGQKSLSINSYTEASYSLVCPFIATNIEDNQCILQAHKSNSTNNCYNVVIDSGKLYLKMTELCDIEANNTYIIEIVVTGSQYATNRSGTIKIYTETGNKIAEETFSYSATSVVVRFGSYIQSGPEGAFFSGKILPYVEEYNFKLGSNNIIVVDTSSLNWDSGTDLTDKTEYADKTNGILYLYENNELVKIGGNLTKKVYTISADNTSTLNVSSDFTKVVDVLKNGVELALTDDYTISSGVITFVTALGTTDKIIVKGE